MSTTRDIPGPKTLDDEAASCVLDIVAVTDPTDMAFIPDGSGIVVAPRWHAGKLDGRLPEAARTVVYYQGSLYGERPARARWEAAVSRAAQRAITEYPSTSSALIPTGHLRVVGRYHPGRGEVTGTFEITDRAALEAWLADTP